MKKIMFSIFSLLIFFSLGCSDNSSDSNPLETNIGGNGTVNVTIGITNGQFDFNQDGTADDAVVFTGTPSTAVRITKVTYSLPAQQINDSYTLNGTEESAANKAEDILFAPTSLIATGQQWTFQFEGTVSSTNQAFNVSVNFTVPDGFGGTGGGGTSSVSITIDIITEQQDIDNDGNPDDALYFTGSSNVNVKLTKVIANLPAQQYTESFDFTGTPEFQTGVPAKLVGYLKSNITTGQQWTFQIEGTESSNNQSFNITSNYTVP